MKESWNRDRSGDHVSPNPRGDSPLPRFDMSVSNSKLPDESEVGH